MKTIVYVEDDRVNALVFQKMLKSTCHVVHYFNADECLNDFEKQKPCGFFLDINLGPASLDGVELMKVIRTKQGYESAKFYAITAYAFSEDKSRLINQGFTGYLSKPIPLDDLLDIIAGLS